MIQYVLGEARTHDAVIDMARAMTQLGVGEVDGFGPYPIEGIDEAMGIPHSPVPLIVLVGGLSGVVFGFFMQWFLNAWDYPINVGGRPLVSTPAFIPITFELGILFAAVSGFLGFLTLCKLPRVWHPVFEAPGFERASIDRFFVSVRLTGGEAERRQVIERLEELGARVTVVEVETAT